MLLDILKACTELEFLHFASFRTIHEDCSLTHAVYVPKLSRLSLHRCDSATILSHIITLKTSTVDVVMNAPKARRWLVGSHILTALPRSLSNVRALEDTAHLILEEDETRGGLRLWLLLPRPKIALLLVVSGHPSLKRSFRSISTITDDPYILRSDPKLHLFMFLVRSNSLSCSAP